MSVCQANDVAYHLDNGKILFENINFSMNSNRIGLLGRNGIGKSLLISLITGARKPTKGHVNLTVSVAEYEQHPSEILNDYRTVAQYLGLEPVLLAIERIAAGECSPELFDQVGDHWRVDKQLRTQLVALGLPPDIHLSCSRLSGGQLTRLRLWRLFSSRTGMLVLDEPSNHLDIDGKCWLLNEIRQFAGHILLVSHDRFLLREMEEIWELSQLGLTRYGGNYDVYEREKSLAVSAVDRQLNELSQQKKRLMKQIQNNREKAEKRAAQGNRVRKAGGQSKLLLDYQKNSAEASVSARRKQDAAQVDQLVNRNATLHRKQEALKAQTLALPKLMPAKGKLLTVSRLRLPYGCVQEISFQLSGSDKLHVQGGNGCGKSSLLKVIAGIMQPLAGEVRRGVHISYLDQDYASLNGNSSVLDHFLDACPDISETAARTRLAGAGLGTDVVFRNVNQLSGGEKMKLAVLIVGYQSGTQLLLLDEPDNHLDLDGKQVLADALKQYQGAFIMVSHDDDFVKDCGVTKSITVAATV